MDTQISFATFFELAPGMLAIDRELDALGCPVAYRKYFAAGILSGCGRIGTEFDVIREARQLLVHHAHLPMSAASTWYNNVYGHLVYEPPASKFVVVLAPRPVIALWNSAAKSVILPDMTLVQYELAPQIDAVLRVGDARLDGLCALQALPVAAWTWLAMSDYDISVESLNLSRPAYHLSLWHTSQCLEKLLKAALLAVGLTTQQVRECGHNLRRILDALVINGVNLPASALQHAQHVDDIVGGPNARYLDDLDNPKDRLLSAEKALNAHHSLLKFFATGCHELGRHFPSLLPSDALVSALPREIAISDLRVLVHREHQRMCSHGMLDSPPYGLPIRAWRKNFEN